MSVVENVPPERSAFNAYLLTEVMVHVSVRVEDCGSGLGCVEIEIPDDVTAPSLETWCFVCLEDGREPDDARSWYFEWGQLPLLFADLAEAAASRPRAEDPTKSKTEIEILLGFGLGDSFNPYRLCLEVRELAPLTAALRRGAARLVALGVVPPLPGGLPA